MILSVSIVFGAHEGENRGFNFSLNILGLGGVNFVTRATNK
jgi:hypothetical protein